jgi:hypothetical protein
VSGNQVRLIAIDPGASTGFAVYTDGILTHAGTGLPDLMCDVVIVEKPEHRPGGKTPVNDLITLAFTAGQCASAYHGATVYAFKPSQWKGSVPKRVHHPRIRALLEPHELAVIPKNAKHDTWDAIGLGLFALKRMGRGA